MINHINVCIPRAAKAVATVAITLGLLAASYSCGGQSCEDALRSIEAAEERYNEHMREHRSSGVFSGLGENRVTQLEADLARAVGNAQRACGVE